MLTDRELSRHVDALSRSHFQQPFTHQAFWNSRLRTTGGRFFPQDGHLDFNPRFFEHEALDQIILHELCHYHLYFAKRGYKHEDQDFKVLLKQVGGLRHAPSLAARPRNYVYQCATCQQLYPRQRQINCQKYRCGRCQGKLRQIKNSS